MNVKLNNIKHFLCKLTLAVFIVGLIPLPGLHQSKALAFSVGDEKEVGEKLLSIVRKSFNVYDDPDIVNYINSLGSRILTVAGHQFFDYHFFVINNSDFNAFAAPSGLIFIHSGLIEAMSNEGELVSVMAHECGHVTSRHISDRIQKTQKTSMLSAAMLIAGIAIGAGPLTEALVAGSMAGSAAMSLKFSRLDEEEADRLAYKWMLGMGMDPGPMVSMLNKMHRQSVYLTANIPPYLLTHPEPKRRMGYVQELIELSEITKTFPARDDFDFLRIKYRIMSKTKSSTTMQAIFGRQATKENVQESQMAHYGLYLSQLEKADYTNAEESLRKVMTLYPDKNILTTDLGVLYSKSNQHEKAFELFSQAAKNDPDCAYTQYNLALAHQKRGENDKALFLYEGLLTKFPDHARIHYNVGNLKAQMGQQAASHYHLGYYFWLEGTKDNTQYHLNQAKNQSEDMPTQHLATTLLKKIERLEKM
nr:M48 family metalloprotease [Desulfobulbaceae bacterium]